MNENDNQEVQPEEEIESQEVQEENTGEVGKLLE